MRYLVYFSAAVSLGFAAVEVVRGEPGKDLEAERIAALIKQLGDDKFTRREAASEELAKIGEPALAALRKAAASSEDAEVRLRARRLVEELAKRPATLPAPQLEYKGQMDYTTAGGAFTRYQLGIKNRAAFPDELFTSSPDLPAIGLNKSASRTVVLIYDDNDQHVYGFVALKSAADLDGIWFARRKGQAPPKEVYVVLHDRKLDRKYKSNLVIPGNAPR